MYCKNCGGEIPDGAQSCPTCGLSVEQPQVVYNNYTYPSKSKWGAFFLCLFLGEFGIHRFYVGKIGTGLLYLFTGGLGGIGWFIDLILILVGSFRDKAGFPLD